MIIEGRSVSVSYSGKLALDKVDFKIQKGEVYSILGHNGAGKSTLIKAIMGLVDYEGDIDVAFNREYLYKNISVQLQTSSFEEGVKVIEVCKLYKALMRRALDVEELLLEFNLYEHRNKYVNVLSGGQKQKLTILLTLLNNPEIIIFDELTTGLDVVARRKIWAVLKKINKEKGTTLILTSHFLDEVAFLADNLLILERGKAKVVGKVDEIVHNLFGDKKKAVFSADNRFLYTKFDFPFTRDDNRMVVTYSAEEEKKVYENIVDCGGYNITIKHHTFEEAFLKILGYELGKAGEIQHV